MRKLGPPPPGTSRQLTSSEARLLGCSAKWHVYVGHDGVILLQRPWKRGLWGVDMSEKRLARLREILATYWSRTPERGQYVRRDAIRRVELAIAQAIRVGQIPTAARRELIDAMDALSA